MSPVGLDRPRGAHQRSGRAVLTSNGKALTVRDVMSLLSGDVRFEIVSLLLCGPQTVSQLAEALELALSTVSQHLGFLRRAGLVGVTPSAKQRVYALSDAIHVEACGNAAEISVDTADGNRVSLMLHVEGAAEVSGRIRTAAGG